MRRLYPQEKRNRINQQIRDRAGIMSGGGLPCKHCGCVEFEHNTFKGENRKCNTHPACPGYEAAVPVSITLAMLKKKWKLRQVRGSGIDEWGNTKWGVSVSPCPVGLVVCTPYDRNPAIVKSYEAAHQRIVERLRAGLRYPSDIKPSRREELLRYIEEGTC